jgi:hypothetical protein
MTRTDSAHAQCCGKRAVRRQERRHHRIAVCRDDRANLKGDDLVQHAKMLAHTVVGDEIAHAIV